MAHDTKFSYTYIHTYVYMYVYLMHDHVTYAYTYHTRVSHTRANVHLHVYISRMDCVHLGAIYKYAFYEIFLQQLVQISMQMLKKMQVWPSVLSCFAYRKYPFGSFKFF